MNTPFTVKNFRNFDAEGTSFELAPITILTGCNSAGKSSLAKAILVLQDILSQVPNVSGLGDLKMDFTTTKFNLGRFDKVINNKAAEGDPITFSYRKYSLLLSEFATVTLSFKSNKEGLNDGVLDKLTITTDNGDTIFSLTRSEKGEPIIESDYPKFKKQFLQYCIGELYFYGPRPLPKDESEAYPFFKDWLPSVRVFDYQVSLSPTIDKCGINSSILRYYQLVDQIKVNGLYPKFRLHEIVDIGTLEYLREKDVINNLPILTELEGKTIDELRDILQDSLNVDEKSYDEESSVEWCKKYIDIMLKDYAESGYTDFVEWYKFLELNYNDVPLYYNNVQNQRSSHFNYSYGFSSEFWVVRHGITISNMPKPEDTYKHNSFGSVYAFLDYECLCKGNVDEDKQVRKWMLQYIFSVVDEMLQIEELKVTEYVRSCRVDVQRLYTFEKNATSFADLILRYHVDREKTDITRHQRSPVNQKKYRTGTFLNKWLSKFGVGESLEFVQTEEGLGVLLYLNKENGERQLLADEGYGITQLVAVLLQIEVAILESRQYQIPELVKDCRKYSENGDELFDLALECYGVEFVSQLMKGMDYIGSPMSNPNEIYRPQTLIIEEPEIHLHPQYQSLLADMFLDAYQTYNIRFIIETHSEYLIRESQVLVSQMGFQSNKESDENSPFRTYYIPKDGKLYSLGYRKDGRFAEKFGDGFYNESTILTNKML